MRYKTTPQFDRSFAALSDDEHAEIQEAIPGLVEAFGKPHEHLGLRKLRKHIYEYRVGLRLRIVFRHDADALSLLFVGNHDEVLRFLRSL